MLKGDLIYIRHDRIKGVSQKNGQEYDFANVTLSDGLESFTMGMDLAILPMLEFLKRGDNVLVTVDVTTQGRSTNFSVSDVKKTEKKQVG